MNNNKLKIEIDGFHVAFYRILHIPSCVSYEDTVTLNYIVHSKFQIFFAIEENINQQQFVW